MAYATGSNNTIFTRRIEISGNQFIGQQSAVKREGPAANRLLRCAIRGADPADYDPRRPDRVFDGPGRDFRRAQHQTYRIVRAALANQKLRFYEAE